MAQAFISFIALIIIALFSSTIFAQGDGQQGNAQQKTQQLIAALGKTKHKKKEKKNFSVEAYAEVKSEAVAKNDVREYAGVYESEGADNRLELRIDRAGKISGAGYDSFFDKAERQNFTLRDIRIEGALLTAIKIYAGGRTEPFEAVFNNRTVTTGKNPSEIESRETKYGLGFIYSHHSAAIDSTSRIFLEYKL